MSHMGQNDPLDTPLPNTKWTEAKGNKIVALLIQGRFKAHACAIVGIEPKTLYNWIEASEKGEHEDWPGFHGFHLRVQQAHAAYCEKAEAEIERLADKGRNPDWKAYSWLLEKKFPGLYGEAAKKVELSGGLTISRTDIIKAIDEDEAEEKDGITNTTETTD